MKKYILAVLFCGTFTFCSCSGFLDEVPKGQITTESYYRTEQHVWGIERSGFFNGREKWAKGFENQRV